MVLQIRYDVMLFMLVRFIFDRGKILDIVHPLTHGMSTHPYALHTVHMPTLCRRGHPLGPWLLASNDKTSNEISA